MTRIDEQAYWQAHQAFQRELKRRSDIDFTGFDHPLLLREEISYKLDAMRDGCSALQLEKWSKWSDIPGKILDATRRAAGQKISHNLLEHRYGPKGNSDSPLYRVSTEDEIVELEGELNELLRGGGTRPEQYGLRFDRFAEFLRERRLGCKWPFLAYLSFLMEPRTYFPVLPGRFGALLKFYGVDSAFAGRVEWSRYRELLDVADELGKRLSGRYGGPPHVIDIQSYMWVVSGLLKDGSLDVGEFPPVEIDPLEDLARRQAQADERERIGFLGEEMVVSIEKQNLIDAGRQDLANQVTHVARISDNYGYDVLSFTAAEVERHIEVKTTQRDRTNDRGFFLSAHEYATAQTDPSWCIIRVWSIDRNANYEELGNVIAAKDSQWKVDPASWLVRPKQ